MNNFPTTFTLVDSDLFNDENEIDHFIHGQTAKNTLLGNKYSLGVFKRFCETLNEVRPMIKKKPLHCL